MLRSFARALTELEGEGTSAKFVILVIDIFWHSCALLEIKGKKTNYSLGFARVSL